MARYYGPIGFALPDQVETAPGVWGDAVEEHRFYGEILNNIRYLRPGQTLNDDISVTNRISVIADAYAQNHFFAIRYISWAGQDWTVSNVDAANPPRLILTLGGVYNGPKPTEPSDDSGDVDGNLE